MGDEHRKNRYGNDVHLEALCAYHIFDSVPAFMCRNFLMHVVAAHRHVAGRQIAPDARFSDSRKRSSSSIDRKLQSVEKAYAHLDVATTGST